jgi:hypothetical protein
VSSHGTIRRNVSYVSHGGRMSAGMRKQIQKIFVGELRLPPAIASSKLLRIRLRRRQLSPSHPAKGSLELDQASQLQQHRQRSFIYESTNSTGTSVFNDKEFRLKVSTFGTTCEPNLPDLSHPRQRLFIYESTLSTGTNIFNDKKFPLLTPPTAEHLVKHKKEFPHPPSARGVRHNLQ